MIQRRLWLLLIGCVMAGVVAAQGARLVFDTPEQTTHFYSLLRELRCVVCQNQDLLESHARIAEDLKREVYHWMVAGRSDTEIRALLRQRYGAFILLKPEVGPQTWVLWFGPFVWLALGGVVLGALVWRSRKHV